MSRFKRQFQQQSSDQGRACSVIRRMPNGFLLADSLLALLIVLLCSSLILAAGFSLHKASEIQCDPEIDRTYFSENTEELQ